MNSRIHRIYIRSAYNRNLIWIVLLCLNYSCMQDNQTGFQQIPGIQKSVSLSEIGQLEYRVDHDSLHAEPVEVQTVKAGQPGIIPFEGTKSVKAGTPRIIPVDSTILRISESGGLNHLFPRVYHYSEPTTKSYAEQMASGNFTVQHGDTIFAPIKTVALRPDPVPALPFRMKETARENILYLDAGQGLTGLSIESIFQDSRGAIWFVTGDAGLCRYDGNYFYYYSALTGLNALTINDIIEDRKGNIWLGTPGGIYKYDGTHFVNYLIRGFVGTTSIVESGNGNIWFGTVGGIVEYNGETWTTYGPEEGLALQLVYCIMEDRSGNIWAGGENGIIKLGKESIIYFQSSNRQMNDLRITSIIEDRQGYLWFGGTGAIRYDGRTFEMYTRDQGLSDNGVLSILEDTEGDVWFGTRGGGISRYNGSSFAHYTSEEGLSNKINCLMEDNDHNIWIGTEGNGVMKFRKRSFTRFTQLENLGSGRIYSIIEDQNSNICIGSENGAFIFNGDSFIHFTEKEGMSRDPVVSMLEDSDGNIWFNHFTSLDRFNGESFTSYKNFVRKRGHLSNEIMCLHEDNKGNLWVGTWGEGVKILREESFIPHYAEIRIPGGMNEGPGQGFVSSIVNDRSGNLWYGSAGMSLLKYDGTSITNYDPAGEFLRWNVFSLYPDTNGNLWIGTEEKGICKFDGNRFDFFTEEQGLSNNFVTSIIEDHGGNIWVGTIHGLSLLLPQEDGGYIINTFGTGDGLKQLHFNYNSVCLDSRNRLWWGTGETVTMLDLNTFSFTSDPPLVQLDNVRLNQNHIEFRAISETEGSQKDIHGLKFSDVVPFTNCPAELLLPHDLNYLTFEYSSVYWSAPQAVRYQYMLEGMEKNWSPLSRETKAAYRNLPPGEFNFRIRAMGRTGTMSEILEYPFRIRRPWWSRWWSLLVYGTVLILLMRYYIRFIISRERLKADLQVRQVEVEKMQELDRMKTRFFTSISHEFRTPLTLILGPIERLLKKNESRFAMQGEELDIIHRNAQRLKRLINQILDISKLETGKIRLQVSEGNLSEFIRRIILSFLSLADSKNIKYQYVLPEDPGQVCFDGDKLEKIITNLVSNAFKFTPAGGEIRIVLKYGNVEGEDTPEHAALSIRDSGTGIPPDQVEKIFDRFYQLDSSATREHEGTGIGLSLTKELVDIYRGTLSVNSEPGMGSTFTVTIPVSKQQFEEDEFITIGSGEGEEKEQQVQEVFEHFPGEADSSNALIRSDSEQPVILIVEDHADLRRYISGNLQEEYLVIEAENGKQGFEAAVEQIPDLVISDLMMPVMDGMEMCSLIKEDERTSHIPVIMLTARADRDSKLEGLQTGADDYVIKPFDAEELKVRVTNLIAQRMHLREKFRRDFISDQTDIKAPYDDLLMQKLMDMINKQLDNPEFNVEQMSEELNMSRTQLYRKVNAITGHAPKDLLRTIRLKKAVALFDRGERNISQVMYRVGFNNHSYFAKCFREQYQVNPSEYVKKKTR